MCLWGKFFLRCSSKAVDLVPIGSLASNTCTSTSEESITLFNSYQILLLWPADIRLSLFQLRSSKSTFLRLSKSLSRLYSLFYTYSASSSKLPKFSFTLLRRLFGPKVYWYVYTYKSLNLFSLIGSCKSDLGIFFDLTKILVGSSSFFAIYILRFSRDFWSIVLT